MADNVVELVVKVTDAASSQIKSIEASVDGMASGVGGLSLKTVAGFTAIGTAVGAATEAFHAFITESSEIQDATVRLDRLYRAFSDTIGVSRESMQAFSDSARQNSRFSDQAIVEMQATLLKFGTITGDSFKRAQQAAIDLGSHFGNLSEGAYIVGRALAYPEQASRVLKEAGVKLDDQQKKLIQSFEEVGNHAGSAAIILGELEKRYRGAAAEDVNTFSGAWERLTNSFKQLFENGGLLQRFTDALNKLNGALQATTEEQERVAIANLKSASSWDKFLDSVTGGGGIDRAIKEREENLAKLVKAREDAEAKLKAADAAAAARAAAQPKPRNPYGDLGFNDVYDVLPGLDALIIHVEGAKSTMADFYKITDKTAESLQEMGNVLEDVSTQGDVSKGIEQATVAIDQQMKVVFKDMTDASNAQIKFYEGVQENFTKFFEDTHEGFKGILKDFIELIRHMVAEALSAKLVDALFGSVSPTGQRTGGGALGAFIGSFFAGGGDTSGGTYLVGEEGPELVTTGPARIMNQRQLSFAGATPGSGNVNFAPVTNINMQPKDTDADSLRQEFYAAIRLSQQQTKKDIYYTMDRNGLGKMR